MSCIISYQYKYVSFENLVATCFIFFWWANIVVMLLQANIVVYVCEFSVNLGVRREEEGVRIIQNTRSKEIGDRSKNNTKYKELRGRRQCIHCQIIKLTDGILYSPDFYLLTPYSCIN